MDDICDSVRTEEEAQELTKYIDSVLETGGLKSKAGRRIKITLTPIRKREKKQRFCKESMKKRY